MKVAAFASRNRKIEEPEIIPNLTFSRLLMDKLTPVVKDPEEEEEEKEKQTTHVEDQNGNSPENEMQKSNLTMKSTNDDFIMVELVNLMLQVVLEVDVGFIRDNVICFILTLK